MKDLGEIKHCLGITVERDENKLSIHQKYSVEQILDKFHMLNCEAAATPMDTNVKLCRDDGVSKSVEPKHNQSLIGSLLYVATATRPDTAEAVGELSKYNAHPTEAHLTAAKRVVRYIKGTCSAKISYHRTGDLQGYSDSSWAGTWTTGCPLQAMCTL